MASTSTSTSPTRDSYPPQPTSKSKPYSGHSIGFFNAKPTTKIVSLENCKGKLPSWLKGDLFCIGPGTFDLSYTKQGNLESETKTFTVPHLFDVPPLAQRFHFNGNENSVSYCSQLVARRLESKLRDNHGITAVRLPTFGSGQTQSLVTKVLLPFDFKKKTKPDRDAVGGSIFIDFPLGASSGSSRLVSLSFTGMLQELDPETLAPKNLFQYDTLNDLFKGFSSCPRPQYDPKTKEWFNFTMDFGYRYTDYNIFVIADDDKREPVGKLLARINAYPSIVHSLVLTENYVILPVQPIFGSYSNYITGTSCMDYYSFQPLYGSMFYVIERSTGKHVVTYKGDALFSFHCINAFEENGNIIFDICSYPDDKIQRLLNTEYFRNHIPEEPLPSSTVTRVTLKDIAKEVEANSSPRAEYKVVVSTSIELPIISPKDRLQPYHHVFGVSLSEDVKSKNNQYWNCIVKADVKKGTVDSIWKEEGCYPCAPVYVENPDPKGEDVIVGVVLDSKRSLSILNVWSSKDLKVLSSFQLPQITPLSFSQGSFGFTRQRNPGSHTELNMG